MASAPSAGRWSCSRFPSGKPDRRQLLRSPPPTPGKEGGEVTPAALSAPFDGAELPLLPRRRPLLQPDASPLPPPRDARGCPAIFPPHSGGGARAAASCEVERRGGVGPVGAGAGSSPGCGAPPGVGWRRLWAAHVTLRDGGNEADGAGRWPCSGPLCLAALGEALDGYHGSPRPSPSGSASDGEEPARPGHFPSVGGRPKWREATWPPRHRHPSPQGRIRSPSLVPPFCGTYPQPLWYPTGCFFSPTTLTKIALIFKFQEFRE